MSYKFYTYELCYPNGTPFYIGKGSNGRINDHEKFVRKGKHTNTPLQRIVLEIENNKEHIVKRIIYRTNDPKNAFIREIRRIKECKKLGIELVNETGGGNGTLLGLSKGRREAISKALLLYYSNPLARKRASQIAKISNARLEVREKISKSLKGRKLSLSHRRNLSKALKGKRLGRKNSPESIEKAASKIRGIPRPLYVRRKISRSRKGMEFTEQHRKRIGDAQRGIPLSRITKDRISKSLKKYLRKHPRKVSN